MTLSTIRARLGSLSPAKLAEIEAVSPCAVRILEDVGKLIDVAEEARHAICPVEPEVPKWAFRLNAALAALEEKK